VTEEKEHSLTDLAKAYFKQLDLVIIEDVTIKGSSGKSYEFEMILKTKYETEINEILVKIYNWKRNLGVDKLIRFERALMDLNHRKGMVISNGFSQSALTFGKKQGVILYSRKNLILSMRFGFS
jgi:hypothetical protein